MKSYKLRLKLSKEQERLAWDYAYTSRRYWNVLVDVDKRNNKGEFDAILQERGNKTYYSEFHERDVYKLNASDYRYLAQFVIAEAYSEDEEQWSWYYRPNQTFIYNTLARDVVKIRYLNKGKLNFRSVGKHTPSFSVRCCISNNKKRPSRIYLKDSGKLQIPTLGDVSIGKTDPSIDLNGKKQVAQVSYDGKYWYLSFSYPDESTIELPDYTDGVGVDLGIKALATVSDGTAIPNINTFRRVRILNLSDLENAKIIVRSQDEEEKVEEISLDLTNTGGLNTTAEFVKLTPNGNQFAIETLNIFSQDTLSILRSKYRK